MMQGPVIHADETSVKVWQALKLVQKDASDPMKNQEDVFERI